ncbi:Piwi domain-containing protein [Chryseobacterium bernardetii]|uniref:Piwi domain-containing protein n=1 Tax=Chryseobacterium bernardetii TaxID=1241978 RepID=UPI000F4D8739|nr:Piwi domain-containing protein [Chryseobacterium bernardetii]AZB34250.1 hypothetical protein EG351_11880 [Chryseobacterium bernardetii]
MTGLFLNIFECKFEKKYFDVQYLLYNDYSDKDKFRELRNEYKDYEFYKVDVFLENNKIERRIYFWQKQPHVLKVLKGTAERVIIQENPRVVSKIIESCIIQYFKNFGKFQVTKKKEEFFWNILSPKNLISELNGLNVFNQFHFTIFFNADNGNISFYFNISRSIKLKFSISKKEFERKGIETKDLKGNDDHIFANKQSLKRFLSATGQQGLYDTKINELERNEEGFKKIKQVYEWLNNVKDNIFLPSNNKFAEFSMKYLPLENDKIQADSLEEPIRYYFENRTEKGRYDDVIAKLKPYSFKVFENRQVKITIVCPKFNEGVLEGFVNQLETTLKNLFHIKVEFANIFLNDIKAESYLNAVYDEKMNTADLAIIILNENHLKITNPQNSPYYICKAKLLGQGKPTQDLQAKHLQKKNPFVINNLALNIYAKIGGIGWTIQNIEKRKDELVVGIGSSMSKDGKRVLGIAQIFHADGRYLVGDCSPLSTFENYAENLENYLYSSLLKVIDETINKKIEFRLIFHLFKSASKNYEIKAVKNVIEKLQNENLSFKYAFVHLAYGHNFRLYTNDGKINSIAKVFGQEYEVNASKKGTYVEISKNRSLVHFVAESTVPLEIEVDKRSTFSDLGYISTQIYWFSHLSHRTFLPSKKAVTILYPSVMSGLLDKLREIDDWDKIRAEKITDKLWFI